MNTSLFSRPSWIGIVVCAAVLATLPILNLAFAPGQALHVSSYTVGQIVKF